MSCLLLGGSLQHLCSVAPEAAPLTDADLKESHSSSSNVDVKISEHVVRKLFNLFPFLGANSVKNKCCRLVFRTSWEKKCEKCARCQFRGLILWSQQVLFDPLQFSTKTLKKLLYSLLSPMSLKTGECTCA